MLGKFKFSLSSFSRTSCVFAFEQQVFEEQEEESSQTAEYGRFRRDLGCEKAAKSRGRGAKMIWGRLGGGQGVVVAHNYKQMAISL